MTERKGTKGLELWCRRMTEGYPGVNITNMTTSWRDGLAFCAIIHHFRPDLIEFSKLNKDDIYHNNELAFRIAERHLGIPALLEPEDMVEFPVPDRLSILTYLSQFYQAFVVSQGKSPTQTAQKRPIDSPDHHGRVSPTTASPPTKIPLASGGGVVKIRREPCAKCNLPVFIAERLNIGKRLYHRTCFRCDRCNSQLTLANYYETENNQYCCEICPDEEQQQQKLSSSSSTQQQQEDINRIEDKTVLTRSLSDEEKTINMKKTEILNELDDYSTMFETALEFPEDNTLKQDSTLTRNARFFINSQIDIDDTIDKNQSDNDDVDDDHDIDNVKPPDLPKTSPPSKSELNYSVSSSDSFLNNDNSYNNNNNNNNSNNDNNNDNVDKLVNNDDNIVTKDTDEGDLNVSLVKSRMLLFENQIETVKKSENNIIVPSPKINNLNNENKKESFDNTNIVDDDSQNTIITISDDSCLNNDDTNDIIIKEDTISTISDNSNQNLSDTLNKIDKIDDKTKILENIDQDYPDDLNPFGDDDVGGENAIKSTETTKISLNPFDEDEDEDQINEIVPKPRTRKKILPPSSNETDISLHIERISVNPFEQHEETTIIKTPQPAVRRRIAAPKISLNPFSSDDTDDDDDDGCSNNLEKPTPKPRTSKMSSADGGSESLSSLSSTYSTSDRKKKKPAPKPPNSESNSLTSTPNHSITHSPQSTPKIRKNRKAPPPPSSTPYKQQQFENVKQTKDEMNRTKQNQNSPPTTTTISDKSTYGKWKRRKGQAPPRPIPPQRRTIKSLPINDIKHELELIEIQQQGLEKQGVRLEQIIRDKCENVNNNPDEPLSPEVDDLILQLFELVNEKNDLFRKQTELMYLRRQHRLEEEHADVEYQIRCLMIQPEATKTDSDKAREEDLIKRLVEIVERRNEIIECLEMDRVREAEEDDCINSQLNLYTLKKDDKLSNKGNKKKLKKKFKLKSSKMDADKDIDECETSPPTSSSTKIKDKKKKKFNIF